MTDLATALSDHSVLTAFENRDVLRAGIEIRNAAGGLRDALAVDPQEWHVGDEVTIVLRCTLAKVRFDPIKETDCLSRIHIFDANGAAIIEDEVVSDALDRQSDRIRRAKEEASGMIRLPYGDELQDAHKRGEHLALVEECPDCDSEADAERLGD